MSTRITLCRGIGEPETTDCVEDGSAENAAVLAPCRVEPDTCRLTSGDAVPEEKKQPVEQNEEILEEEGCCGC